MAMKNDGKAFEGNEDDQKLKGQEDLEDIESANGAEDSDGDDGNDAGSSNEEDDDNKNSEKTFTQSDVNRMMTREKKQGRNAAYKEMGIDPTDSKMVAMFKAFVASQKTDEDKAREEADDAKAKVAEAEQRALVAEAKAEAMVLGVNSQFVEDIVTLALGKLTDDSDLKTLIGELKDKYPAMFDAPGEEDDKNKTGKKGTGAAVKPTGKGKDDNGKSYGARLAAQRKPSAPKKSYWGNNK